LAFLFLATFFLALQQLSLFLITWDRLNVTEIDIVCGKSEITEEVRDVLSRKNFGNILLLDIGRLQDALTDHRWIKKVRVKKIFPSSLRIEIEERIPEALVKKENFYLIDRDNVELEKVDPQSKPELPLLIDKNYFRQNYDQKMDLAWRCLEELSPEEREKIEILDLSEYENLSLKLKESGTWLILGNDRFAEKLRLHQKNRARLQKYGTLEYVDFRFQDRMIIKPLQKQGRDHDNISQKEEN